MAAKHQTKQRGTGRPFVKDDPRINRKGRPRAGICAVDRLRRRFNTPLPKNRSWFPKSWQQALEIADRLWPGQQQTFGDLWDALRLLRGLTDEQTAKSVDERINGKPVQPLANDPENPLISGGIAEAVARADRQIGAAN